MHTYRGPGDDLAADLPTGEADHVEGGRNLAFWEWFDGIKGRLDFRASTFEAMFRYLDKIDLRIHIVETGCMRDPDNWEGDGCSTILFDRYVAMREYGGNVTSIDINESNARLCRQHVGEQTFVANRESVGFLKDMAFVSGRVDLLYLDSFDLDTSESLLCEAHHLAELMAAMPMISPTTLVVVDDSTVTMNEFGMVEIVGKGAMVARYAIENEAELQFAKYQIGWTGMNKREIPAQELRGDADLRRVCERAWAYMDKGSSYQASTIYKLVLDLTKKPRTPTEHVARGEACVFFGRAAMQYNRPGLAMDWYCQAIALNPGAWGDRLEYATKVLRPQRLFEEGRRQAMLATRTNPEVVDAWRILGGFAHDCNDFDGAKDAYEEALRLGPDDVSAMLDMISLLLEEPDYERCEALARRVIAAGGQFEGTGYESLACIYYRYGKHEEAIGYFDKALALGVKQEASCHWNRGLALHCIGRYREGWDEHVWRSKERTQAPIYMPMLRFNRPLWEGQSGPASIHVHAEAGAGDNLCCARYLKVLVEQGYDVRFECYADMVSLMRRSFPGVKVTPQAFDYPGSMGIEPFDYHCPIGELPHALKTEVDTVPWFGPYLVPDRNLVAGYKSMISTCYKKKIGLCWSAGIREGIWIAKYGARKSMHFNDLRKLFYDAWGFPPSDAELLDRIFISLQIGPERSQQNDSYIHDLLPAIPSWDDTAALIANLDLVITVDTSVAHLAGAMGVPVWLMNTCEPGSWHWMAERPGAMWNERSPWYPSVRIYRQQKVGEWDDVVRKIALDLQSGLRDGRSS